MQSPVFNSPVVNTSYIYINVLIYIFKNIFILQIDLFISLKNKHVIYVVICCYMLLYNDYILVMKPIYKIPTPL